jgi:hypothetical protein
MSPIPSTVYEAEMEIFSDGMVPNNGNVIFDAGHSIELLPGFEVGLGGVFEMLLEGCVT